MAELLSLPSSEPSAPSATRVAPPRAAGSQNVIGKRLTWAAIASIAVLLLAMAVPALQGKVFVADDLGQFHLPLRQFYAAQLAAGQSFDWMPSLYGGMYLTGEGQAGVYHPLHLLLYHSLPLAVAWNLEVLFSYPWMLLGLWLLLRRYVGPGPALAGAIAFGASGFCLLHFVHVNAVAVVSHWPWLIWALDISLAGWRDRSTAHRTLLALTALALLTASQLLLGYPQYVWLGLVLQPAWLVWRLASDSHWQSTDLPRRRWPLGAGWMIANLIGLAIAGVQLMPTLETLGLSTRAASGVEFAQTGSLHPLNLVQLVAPYLFATRVVGQNTHELGLYCGAVPVVLIAWMLGNRSGWGRVGGLFKFGLALAAIGLLLAFGAHTLLGELQSRLPLVGSFRFPCRAIALVHFGAALATAAAFGVLIRLSANKTAQIQTSPAWLLASVVASGIASLAGIFLWSDFIAAPLLAWSGPVLLATAAGAVVLAMRRPKVGAPLLVCLMALDLGVYGLSYAAWPGAMRLEEYVAGADSPPSSERALLRVAYLDDHVGGLRVGNRLLLAGAERIDGYAGLEPATRIPDRRLQARLAGATWWRESNAWQAVPGPLARARLLAKAKEIEPTRTLDTDMIASWNIETTTIVDATPAPLTFDQNRANDSPDSDNVQIAVDSPGRIVLRTDASGPRILALTERFHPGWTATIDGAPSEALCVNGDFMGCAVSAGPRQIELKFAPASLCHGRWISIFGLLLGGLLLFLGALAARRAPRGRRASA